MDICSGGKRCYTTIIWIAEIVIAGFGNKAGMIGTESLI